MSSDHPTYETLLAFVRGSLETELSTQVEKHLVECDECAEALIQLSGHDELAERVRDGIEAKSGSDTNAESRFISELKIRRKSDELQAQTSGIVGSDQPTEVYQGEGHAVRFKCPHCGHGVQLVQLESGEVVCESCGSSFRVESRVTVPDRPAEAPRAIGKFEILEQLGRGAFGAVYKARDTELDRVVAVKVPRAGYFGSTDEEQRFLREARSAAHLRHHNIVQVHEIAYERGVPYIVSEYIEGRTLEDVISSGLPTFPETAELVATIAEALDYAHRQKIIHRDIKPSNILIGFAGQPYVTDFGLARRDEGEITMTVEGQILGTPAYMSPEQAAGDQRNVEGRSDVYSLGVVLYELLTGERPFSGNKRMLLQQVLYDEPRPPRRVNDRIPRDLETICLKALAKSPARRYDTARELADDLRRYRKGEPIHARPVGRVERLQRWARRNPVIATLVAVIGLSLVAGIVVSSYFAVLADGEARRADKNAKEAVANEQIARRNERDALRNLYLAEVNVAQQHVRRAEIPQAIKVLERLRVSSDNIDRRSFEWYYLWQLCHRQDFTLHCFVDKGWMVDSIGFDPKGKFLAVAGGWVPDGDAEVWDLATRQVRLPLPAARKDLHAPLAVSADGTMIATAVEDGSIQIWNSISGRNLISVDRRQAEEDMRGIGSLAFSQDSATLAVGLDAYGPAPSVELWNLESRQVEATFDGVSRAVFSPDSKTLAVGGQRQRVRIIDVESRQERFVISASGAVAFSPDSSVLVTVSGTDEDRGKIEFWSSETGVRVAEFVNSHTGGVIAVAYSPDGQFLATGSYDRTIKLWHVATQEELTTFGGHESQINQVAFSPDGKQLASGSSDGRVMFWDVDSFRHRSPLLGNNHVVRAIAYSPDGQTLAVAGWDADHSEERIGLVKLWDAESRRCTVTLTGLRQAVHALAFSSDGTTLVTAGGDWDQWQQPGEVRLWDCATGDFQLELSSVPQNVTDVAISPDGRIIATAGGVAKLWDAQIGEEIATLTGFQTGVYCVAFTPDGQGIAVGGGNWSDDPPTGEIRLYDAQTFALRDDVEFDGLGNVVYRLHFSSDGQRLVSADWNKTAVLWDVSTGEIKHVFSPHAGKVWEAVFSPDGSTVATASDDGYVRLWDTNKGHQIAKRAISGQHGILNSGLAYSHHGESLALGTCDNVVKLLDPKTLEQRGILGSGHTWTVSSIDAAPDGRTFATGGSDQTVRLWETESGKELAVLHGHEGKVAHVAFSADGGALASAGWDMTVRLWDVAARRELRSLEGHTGEVYWVAFSPDGKTLASACVEKQVFRPRATTLPSQVKLWNLDTYQEIATLDASWPVAFSRGGKFLATGPPSSNRAKVGDTTRRVIVWDVTNRHEVGTFAFTPTDTFLPPLPEIESWCKGPLKSAKSAVWKAAVRSSAVALCPDGKTVAMADFPNGQTIRIFDVATGMERLVLPGHGDDVTCLAFTPDGRTLISGTGNMQGPAEIRLWRGAEDRDVDAQITERDAERQARQRALQRHFKKYESTP